MDTDSAQKSIQGDLREINPKAEHNWFLYRKVPWEGYLKKKFNFVSNEKN